MTSGRSSEFHICLVQPLGQVHALGLLDPARYFQHQLGRLGHRVSLGKNRLRRGMPNFVFGAHLAFDKALLSVFDCVLVNLEQLGPGGSPENPAYLDLLRSAPVVDYDARNAAHYSASPDAVPLIGFGRAEHLRAATDAVALEARPIELLFIGSPTPRRLRLIERIEATGRVVTMVNAAQPVYGPERDELVRQARAVLNCHAYETAVFEQVRAFQVLSLGTPIVSERTARTRAPAAFDACLDWFEDDTLEDFFTHRFPAPGFCAQARARLDAFRHVDPLAGHAAAAEFALSVQGVHLNEPPVPQRLLHLGSGKDYRPGWLNVDIQKRTQPDVIADLGRPQVWPLALYSPYWGEVRLEPGATELIFANNVLEHVPDLATLMGNCLELLRDGGQMIIEVPYERSLGAWQDPTHVRAMNENSWLYYTDWFWYLGWFDHRFVMRELHWLDAALVPCAQAGAAFMRLRLEKTATTIAERTAARTLQPDCGGLLEALDYARPESLSPCNCGPGDV
jgi:SAM-dependent methyltransferase